METPHTVKRFSQATAAALLLMSAIPMASASTETLRAIALTVDLASTPVSTTVAPGDDDVEMVGFIITAYDEGEVFINHMQFAAYVDEDSDGRFHRGKENTIQANEMINAVWLEDGEGNVISDYESINSKGLFSFDGMSYTIEAGNTDRVVVMADISSVYAGYPISLAINTGDRPFGAIGAEDEDGNAVRTWFAERLNHGTHPLVAITVAE